jgi:hypothetical protein
LFEKYVKHTNTLFEKNAEFQYVKAGGTYVTTGLERVKHLLNMWDGKFSQWWL